MTETNRQILNVIVLCLFWYIISSSNNVIGKMVLSEFPYPMTVTMVQLTSITLYSGPFFNLWGVRKYADMSWRYYFRFIVPLALGKFFASVTSHISIWKVPVSYAHTGKYLCQTKWLIKCCVLYKYKWINFNHVKDTINNSSKDIYNTMRCFLFWM